MPEHPPQDPPAAPSAEALQEDAPESGLAPEDAGDAVGGNDVEEDGGGHGSGVNRLSTGLVVGALGVVFGDIGTSPLYALKTVFTIDGGAVRPTTDDVYGVISLMFWSITIVVSVKYVSVVMRADNEGEGGVMALIALVRRILGDVRSRTRAVVALGILGASLFYGDTLITPAISVLSAVEGVQIAAPGLSSLVLPIAGVILTVLFAGQRFGTGRVGALFGPVMLAWFALLAVAGLGQVVQHPHVLVGLLPTHAVSFVFAHPYIAFIAIGAVVLVITGAEALYADMGHFGRRPIAWAWFVVVLPALTLNYLGQAALILQDPASTENPFLLLMPGWARIPVVVLATAATVIASQAVISGAFSVTRQAIQLGFLPTLTVRQTSRQEGGQVYLPAVNAALFIGVLTLMLVFRSSERLATAYGIAVTGALLIDTVLLLVLARVGWGWSTPRLVLAGVAFGGLETLYLSGNLAKVLHGGWLPLLIALGVFTVMTTWQRGRQIVIRNRTALEGPLQAFVDELHEHPVPRVPGAAVFPHPSKDTAPLALRANVRHNGVLHETVVVVSARPANVPVVAADRRVRIDDLGYDDDGIVHLALSYGFSEAPDIPAALDLARREGLLPDLDLGDVSYFLSRATLRHTSAPGMARWRKLLFIALAHNAANPSEYFGLPGDQTVVMGTHVDV
jgi:KUP system potassium uptake protein